MSNAYITPFEGKVWVSPSAHHPKGACIKLRGPVEPSATAPVVLFTHGLSAGSNTIEANEKKRCLAQVLREAGADVWLLDWRGSCDPDIQKVAAEHDHLPVAERRTGWGNFHRVASLDLVEGIRFVYDLYKRPLRLLAHCMGAAAVSRLIAMVGVAPGEVAKQLTEPGRGRVVDRLVLTTGGLFLKTPDSRSLLVEDHIIAHYRGELTREEGDRFPARIDTRSKDDWPTSMRDLYVQWTAAKLGPFRMKRLSATEEPFALQTYLYGEPYDPAKLPGIHATGVEDLFGMIDLDLMADAAGDVRAGALLYRPIDKSDPKANFARPFAALKGAARAFNRLDAITLVTGARNRLWHRSSIDCMYDWLTREIRPWKTPVPKPVIRKVVFPKYAHQDLYWGEDAPTDIYPTLLEGLGLVAGTGEQHTP
jgi:pimeloyl-ACP methyl ester carboxylesterase